MLVNTKNTQRIDFVCVFQAKSTDGIFNRNAIKRTCFRCKMNELFEHQRQKDNINEQKIEKGTLKQTIM